MLKTRVLPFEFETLRRLTGVKTDWSNERLLIAFSGGKDSIVLLNALTALKVRLKFELVVAHVHHGASSVKSVNAYRNKAANFAKKQSELRGLDFHLLKHSGAELKSEAEFRKVREGLLENCRKKANCSWLVFAHHSGDLLETRLIRLIRGTGAQGLKAMNLAHGNKLRPLLNRTPEELDKYAVQQNLKWVTDPTNQEDQYFRNWIRNTWLPMLEIKRLGSKLALGRSLEQISESLSQSAADLNRPKLEAIKRNEFSLLNVIQKRELVARLLLEQGARDFSRRQIDEILKRLSSPQSAKRRKLTFSVGGFEWRVNAEQIEAVRL